MDAELTDFRQMVDAARRIVLFTCRALSPFSSRNEDPSLPEQARPIENRNELSLLLHLKLNFEW